MDTRIGTSLSMLLLASWMTAMPATAAAQPVPDTGQVAAGLDVGMFLPTDEQFDSSITGGGFFEVYLTPRLGVRVGVMAMRPEYIRGNGEQERQLRIGGDVIYNWELGNVHPFAGGGLGMHRLQLNRDGDAVGPSSTKLGISGLGGFEFFMNREWTVKAEGRYQWVADTALVNPDGFSMTIGIKRYF